MLRAVRLLWLLFLFPASPAWATLSVDIVVFKTNTTDGTTLTTSAFSTAGANELLLAFTSMVGSGVSPTVTVSGAGLTWTRLVRSNGSLGAVGASEIWYAYASGALSSQTVTATWSASRGNTLVVVAYIGAATAPINGTATDSTNNANHQEVTINASAAGSYLVGIAFDFSGSTQTADANTTKVHEDSDGHANEYTTYRLTSTTAGAGNVTFGASAPTGDGYDAAWAEVPAATGGGAATPTRTLMGVGT